MDGKIFLPAASAFILLVLASCSSAPTTPPPSLPEAQQPLAPEGQGSGVGGLLATVSCRDFVSWVSPFIRQYPHIDLAAVPDDYQSQPQAANLFRDSDFLPRFGVSYEPSNAGKISPLAAQAVACRNAAKDETERNFFITFEKFFDSSFRKVDLTLARLAADYNRRARWMNDRMASLSAVTPDAAGVAQLDVDTAYAQNYLAPLWPLEQRDFAAAAAARRQEIVTKLGPGSGPQGKTIEERVQERVGELERIPLTVEGRQQNAEWITSFDREFQDYRGNDTVRKAGRAGYVKREKIFKATKPDFMAKLAKMPKGEGSEAANAKLLSDTFPLHYDSSMQVYQDYKDAILSRQKPFFRRSFDKAVEWMRSVKEGISDAAKKTVHGAPSTEGTK